MTRWLRRVRRVGAATVSLAMLGGAALAEPVTITLLHTNDVYEIAPREGRGGLAELATLLRTERAIAEHSITTFGGDLISPSVLSGMTQGAQMIDLYNRLGTDVAVLGNHEFDFGPEVAAARIRESEFPWLGTNVLGRDGKPALGTVDLHVVEVGDPLDVGRTYRVATNDYIYRGGDGYEALGRGKPLIDASGGALLANMVIDYIKQQGEIAPAVEGRITRVD